MLKETLKKDELAAMKARDKAWVSVLRLVNSEIKSFEVNNRENISDENVIKIVEKSIKQNKEALEYAIKANDEDKIPEGKFAIEVLTPYLPKQLTEEEVNAMLREIITNGVEGFLIACYDKEKMADRISELIENKELRIHMSNNSRCNLDKFDKRRILSKWESIIDNIWIIRKRQFIIVIKVMKIN